MATDQVHTVDIVNTPIDHKSISPAPSTSRCPNPKNTTASSLIFKDKVPLSSNTAQAENASSVSNNTTSIVKPKDASSDNEHATSDSGEKQLVADDNDVQSSSDQVVKRSQPVAVEVSNEPLLSSSPIAGPYDYHEGAQAAVHGNDTSFVNYPQPTALHGPRGSQAKMISPLDLDALFKKANHLHDDYVHLDNDYYILHGTFAIEKPEVFERFGWKIDWRGHAPLNAMDLELIAIKKAIEECSEMLDDDPKKSQLLHELNQRVHITEQDLLAIAANLTGLRVNLEGNAIVQYSVRSSYRFIGNQPNYPQQFFQNKHGKWVQNGTIRIPLAPKEKKESNAIRAGSGSVTSTADSTISTVSAVEGFPGSDLERRERSASTGFVSPIQECDPFQGQAPAGFQKHRARAPAISGIAGCEKIPNFRDLPKSLQPKPISTPGLMKYKPHRRAPASPTPTAGSFAAQIAQIAQIASMSDHSNCSYAVQAVQAVQQGQGNAEFLALQELARDLQMENMNLNAKLILYSTGRHPSPSVPGSPSAHQISHTQALQDDNVRLVQENMALKHEIAIFREGNGSPDDSPGSVLGKRERSVDGESVSEGGNGETAEMKSKKRRLERQVQELEYRKDDLEEVFRNLERRSQA
ncbi:hypothetical protein BJ878DRAFT_68943 [Calycina marina]|uniref:Uncharacterized protein n=1 Tax=Calycina marina TaxID=1763456 RepID=A0A9P7Z354_9HELO|nr:hypothetical protein BJ878DRAFT_68943 [Calycina marina]